MSEDQESEVQHLKDQIIRLRKSTKISQIVVSRCVKMPRGGGDILISLTGTYDEGGLSLSDAKMATHLLGLEANVMAFQQARASGILSNDQMESAIRHTKNNFGILLVGDNKK